MKPIKSYEIKGFAIKIVFQYTPYISNLKKNIKRKKKSLKRTKILENLKMSATKKS
jgi:hypothetical protein